MVVFGATLRPRALVPEIKPGAGVSFSIRALNQHVSRQLDNGAYNGSRLVRMFDFFLSVVAIFLTVLLFGYRTIPFGCLAFHGFIDSITTMMKTKAERGTPKSLTSGV